MAIKHSTTVTDGVDKQTKAKWEAAHTIEDDTIIPAHLLSDGAPAVGKLVSVDPGAVGKFAFVSESGLGDMLKATYDPDLDGKVETADLADNADLLDSLHAAAFALSGHTHGQLHDRGHTMASALDHTDWPAGLTVAELAYVHGVTSAIQTQLDARLPLGGGILSGSLGIGAVAVPSDYLHIAKDGSVYLYVQAVTGSGQAAGIRLQRGAWLTDVYTDWGIFDTGGVLTFTSYESNSTLDRVKFTADGKVGIGCDPSYTLDVSGSIHLTGDHVVPVKDAIPSDTPPVGTMRLVRLGANQTRIYVYTADGWQWVAANKYKRYIPSLLTTFLPNGSADITGTAGRVFLCPIQIEEPTLVDAFQCQTSAQGGAGTKLTMGLYQAASDIPDGQPVVVQAETAADNGGGITEAAFTPMILSPALYYLALETADGVVGFYRMTGIYVTSATFVPKFWGCYYDRAGGYGALTNPCPATTAYRYARPLMGLRVAA